MAWNVPSTAVSGSPFTAATFNQQVRDNLLATAPALATTISSFFVTASANTLAERIPAQNSALGSSTTTSASYTPTLVDAITTSVTVNTGSGALVMIYANLFNNTLANATYISFAVSGATVSSSNDDRALQRDFTGGQRSGIMVYQNGMTPGNNTFTLQYKVAAGTGTFSVRRIAVIPF